MSEVSLNGSLHIFYEEVIIMTKYAVNPALWSGLDYLFGTSLSNEANRLGLSPNVKDTPASQPPVVEALPRHQEIMMMPHRERIGTIGFSINEFKSDAESIIGAVGFNKEMIDNVDASSSDKTFKQVLKVLDAAFSILDIVPADDIGACKSFIKSACQTIREYIPDFRSIGGILSIAPGISKYSKFLVGFGESLDEAIDIINRDSTDSITKAIKKIREGIHKALNIDLDEIEKEVKANVIDVPSSDINDVKTDTSDNKKKKEVRTMNDVAGEAAMYQGMVNPIDMWQQFQTQNQSQHDNGFIPDFVRDGYKFTPDVTKSVPEYIAENTLRVPRENVNPFTPVEQAGGWIDPACNIQCINDIQSIANANGYFMKADPIRDAAGNVVMIYVGIYNSNAFLWTNSFVIDLGTVIDRRFGIWPCVMQNGSCMPVENCSEAYMLYTKDNQFNAEFVQNIVRYGFPNLTPEMKKKNILYGVRMTETNRRICLITLNHKDLNGKSRNIIKGACIRMATKIDPSYGRFIFKEIDPKTLSFVLTNEGVTYFPSNGQYTCNCPKVEIIGQPKIVDGKYVPVNENGGTDIIYDISINLN